MKNFRSNISMKVNCINKSKIPACSKNLVWLQLNSANDDAVKKWRREKKLLTASFFTPSLFLFPLHLGNAYYRRMQQFLQRNERRIGKQCARENEKDEEQISNCLYECAAVDLSTKPRSSPWK